MNAQRTAAEILRVSGDCPAYRHALAREQANPALTAADVTARPKCRPAELEDGTPTGMWITLHDSVALSSAGAPVKVPAGAIITQPISGGFDSRLPSTGAGANSSTCKIGLDGDFVSYLVG